MDHDVDPEADPASLTVPALRALRARLLAQESRVSYWRHLVLARIDQLGAGRPPAVDAQALAPLLRTLAASHPRGERIIIATPEPDDRAVDLRLLWDEVLDPDDAEGLVRARRALDAAAQRLSAERHCLHRRIDAATAELVARYREDPMRALESLPDI